MSSQTVKEQCFMPSEYLTRGVDPTKSDLRSEMRGVNVDVTGREFPRVAWKHFRRTAETVDADHDAVLVTLLSALCAPESDAWKNFMAVRTGKRVQQSDGTGLYEVKKRIMPRYIPPFERKMMEQAAEQGEKGGSKVKVKSYTLAQILSDSYLRDKYQFSKSFINTIAALAINKPADAAATVKEYLERVSTDPDLKFKVSAGAYATGVAAACRDISLMAAQHPRPQIGIPATIVGGWLYLDGVDADGDPWQVKGPLRHAPAVEDVYRIALGAGAHPTIHCLGVETARLSIDIFIRGAVVSSSVVGHGKGKDQQDLRFMSKSGMEDRLSESLRKRFEALRGNVLPLLDEGVHISSAVRLSDKVVVVNQHTVEPLDQPMVHQQLLVSRQVLGDDLWAYRNNGKSAPWSYREPVANEEVCIMYHNGAEVVLSPAFKILTCDGSVVQSRYHDGIVPGMSGGALVSLTDFSLLGIHCGQNLSHLKAVRVTRTAYDDLCEFVTDTQVSGDSPVAVEQMIVSRGLGPAVVEAVNYMLSVERDGVHVGTATMYDGAAWSVFPGSKTVTAKLDGLQTDLSPCDGSVLYSTPWLGDRTCFQKMRSPQLGESVVLLGKDKDGAFRSNSLTVSFLGPQRKNFFVTSEPTEYEMAGSLVMSLSDGAVMGMVVRPSKDVFFCVAFPVSVLGVNAKMDELSKAFPRMQVSAWDEKELESALDVGNVEKLRGMSALGAGVLQLSVRKACRADDLPDALWDKQVERLMDDARVADVFFSSDLAKFVGAGVRDDRVLSRAEAVMVFQALVSVMAEHERPVQVNSWLYSVGFLEKEISTPRNSLTRRPSGFQVVSDDGRPLAPYGE